MVGSAHGAGCGAFLVKTEGKEVEKGQAAVSLGRTVEFGPAGGGCGRSGGETDRLKLLPRGTLVGNLRSTMRPCGSGAWSWQCARLTALS